MEGDVKDWDWETWPMGRIPHYFWYVFSHIWLSNQPSRRKLVKYRDLGVAGVVFQFFLKNTTMECENFFFWRDIHRWRNPKLNLRRLRSFHVLKMAPNGNMHFCILRKIRSLRSFFSKTMRWRVIYQDGQERYIPGDESHANLGTFKTFLFAQKDSFL